MEKIEYQGEDFETTKGHEKDTKKFIS